MDKIVKNKEELKEAIKNKEQTIVIGNEKLAKKIFKIRKPFSSFKQKPADKPKEVSPLVMTGCITGLEVVLIISIFAIFMLGASIMYALWKSYDVIDIVGKGGGSWGEGDPHADGGFRVSLRRKAANSAAI